MKNRWGGKIDKKDIFLILSGALGGFILVAIAITDLVTALVAGIPSGALGGCAACLLRNFEFKA
jgi:hypothetical protein